MTIAGVGGSPGSAGDGGPALAAQLSGPQGIVVVPGSRWIYVTDRGNHAVRLLCIVGQCPPSATQTSSRTQTASNTPSATRTASQTPSRTPTLTSTPSPTKTSSISRSLTTSPTTSVTPSETQSTSQSLSPTLTASASSSSSYQQLVWDLASNFSLTLNPNGAWQYGKYNASTFYITPSPTAGSIGGSAVQFWGPVWYQSASLSSCFGVPYQFVSFSSDSDNPAALWTAPYFASYSVRIRSGANVCSDTCGGLTAGGSGNRNAGGSILLVKGIANYTGRSAFGAICCSGTQGFLQSLTVFLAAGDTLILYTPLLFGCGNTAINMTVSVIAMDSSGSQTKTATQSQSPSLTQTQSRTEFPTPSQTQSLSLTLSPSATTTQNSSPSATSTPTSTLSISGSASTSSTLSQALPPSQSQSSTLTASNSATPTPSLSASPSQGFSASQTGSQSLSPTLTASFSGTSTHSQTATPLLTPSVTQSVTQTASQSPSLSATPAQGPSVSQSTSQSLPASQTLSASQSPSRSMARALNASSFDQTPPLFQSGSATQTCSLSPLQTGSRWVVPSLTMSSLRASSILTNGSTSSLLQKCKCRGISKRHGHIQCWGQLLDSAHDKSCISDSRSIPTP